MPDWRNPDDYAYLKDCDLHQWAWEFLRRNKDFRRAYFALEFALEETSKREALEIAQEEPVAAETSQDPHRRTTFWKLYIAASAPWGLISPADPRCDFHTARALFKHRAGVEILSSWETNKNENWPGYPDVVALKFDLNYSVEISIEIAAEQLRRFSQHLRENSKYQPRTPKKTRRFHRDSFPLYARILDAALAGASDGEITNALFAGHRGDPRRSMTKVRETANRMAAIDYRELLLLAPRGP